MPFWCILAPQWTNFTKWKSKFSHSSLFLLWNKSCSEGSLFIVNFQFWNCIPKKFQIFRNLGKNGKNLGFFFRGKFSWKLNFIMQMDHFKQHLLHKIFCLCSKNLDFAFMTELQNRAWNKKPSADFFRFYHFGNLRPYRFKRCIPLGCTFFLSKNIQ